MKKYVILGLSCVLAATMFAGCRRNNMAETSTATKATTHATTQATTHPTTHPTHPSTHPTTKPTEHTTEATQMPSILPQNPSESTEPSGRTRHMPPKY